MLNSIKSMIKEKTDFLEAAAIIYEDGSGTNLDDQIVLGEDKDTPDPTEDLKGDNDGPEKDDHDEPEGKDDDNDNSSDDGEVEDISDMPINDEPPKNDEPAQDDILDSKIDGDDQPLPLPGEDLPTPVGAQTGEPINPDDDILNTEIDLGSNTIKDVLPVPPANAGEAIADSDSINQHVDSGFGGDSETQEPAPVNAEPEAGVAEPGNEEVDPLGDTLGESSHAIKESLQHDPITSFMNGYGLFSEAITLGDDPAPAAEGEAPKEDAAAPAAEEPTDDAAPAAGEESEVTAAVRDKVSEADTPAPGGDAGENGKEALLKKLGSITKSLEDAKKAVMNSIQ